MWGAEFEKRQRFRRATSRALAKNRERRAQAEREQQRARAELARLLRRGRDAAHMPVTELADEAGVSRQHAHDLLRERGAA